MEDSISSYGKIFALGHKALHGGLFDGPVVVEEKVDGSQLSFRREGDCVLFRSRGAVVRPDAAGMFQAGVDAVMDRRHLLEDGHTYRGEYLAKPKHNSLAYSRIPRGHIAIWDIERGDASEDFLSIDDREELASKAGFESVPVLHIGQVTGAEDVESFLDRESFLGGNKVEGVVIKNYNRFGRDGKILKGKYVSEAFKEVHKKDYRARHPTQSDILERLVEELRAEARWEKAVQRLRDAGTLDGSPRDIGALIKSAQSDVMEECEGYIKDELYAWAKGHIRRKCTAGLAEWYKRKLMEDGFSED